MTFDQIYEFFSGFIGILLLPMSFLALFLLLRRLITD